MNQIIIKLGEGFPQQASAVLEADSILRLSHKAAGIGKEEKEYDILVTKKGLKLIKHEEHVENH